MVSFWDSYGELVDFCKLLNCFYYVFNSYGLIFSGFFFFFNLLIENIGNVYVCLSFGFCSNF